MKAAILAVIVVVAEIPAVDTELVAMLIVMMMVVELRAMLASQ